MQPKPINTIRCGISQAFDEKHLKPGYTNAAFGDSFKPTDIDLRTLAAHVLQGGAWIPGQFQGANRTNDTFIGTALVALDYDENVSISDLLAVPFVHQYAALIYPTASSRADCYKTRAVFILDAPVHRVEATRTLIRAIADHIGLPYDPASYKPAQLFYGSRNTVEKAQINPLAVLPLALAAGLTADLAREDYRRHQDAQEQKQKRKPVDPASPRAEKYAAAAYDRILHDIASAPDGSKNNALFKGACDLFAIAGWPGISVSRIEADLESIYGAWPNVHKSRGTVASAKRTATPRPLELDEQPAKKQRPSHGRVDGDESEAAQDFPTGDKSRADDEPPFAWVSDDLTPEAIAAEKNLLIAAPVGMGKTRAIAEYVASLPAESDVTGIAQFRLLTVALSEALKALHYEDLSAQEQTILSSAPRLVSSVSSLHKFPGRQGGVVIADEIEGVLQFILNSGTFEGAESAHAFQALRALVQNASQFIGMDAGLSAITESLIRQWRGNIAVKRYSSGRKPRKVSFLRDKHAAFWTIGKALRMRRGAVYAACTSEADASDLADLYSDGEYRVLKITRDTSNTPTVQAFIRNAHNERAAYDLVIYTSAAGAGVDFSNPVYAHVGIFGKEPLAPEQAIQLYGRVRNAQRFFAAVPPMNEPYPTPTVEQLIADRLRRELWTAQKNGTVSAGGDYLEMLKLWAAFKARALQESAQWRKYFAGRLQANGFSVRFNDARAPIEFVDQVKQWRVERSDADWSFVLEAVGQSLTDESLDKLRMGGQKITHDLKLRNIRAKIEGVLHHEHVTADDRDLMQYKGRKRLSWLTDLFTDSGDLLASDLNQSNEGAPLQKRKYRALNSSIVSALLKLAGFDGKTPEAQLMACREYFRTEHPNNEVTERFKPWATDAGLRKIEALGHHGNNATTVTGLVRFFFNLIGFDLNSIRRGRAEGRYRAYILNAETTDYRIDRAMRAAALRQADTCTQNVHTREKTHFGYTAKQDEKPPEPGWRPGAAPRPSAANEYFEALKRSGKPANPFATKGAA